MKKILNKIEKTFSAVTFAEAGEPEIALELINSFEDDTAKKHNVKKNKGKYLKQTKFNGNRVPKLKEA